ncbi:hypothetical protein [Mucispirillum schaedleri]|uniref:hypothetical protein n=1 Tax=Mucispirillum schaedleri TaxID=248039 RepID=UPI001F56CBF6|nr:hypothetical protein [Mucispirillum schaedleri]
MKPMAALITTGIVLLLIMLYFGNKSFEGTFETNIYQNSIKYNKTAPVIKELEKTITNVRLENIPNADITKFTYNYNYDQSKYSIVSIDITYPNKPDIIPVIDIDNYNGIKQKLAPGLYIVVFHFLINENNNTVKVMKSVYVE